VNLMLLPDRERRHLLQFYVWPRLGYRTRLAVAGGLILVALAIQLLWSWSNAVPLLLITLPILLVGNLLLLVRGYNLAPAHSGSTGQWEKTTRDRFRQVPELERQIRRWDETFVDVTCVTGALCLLAAAGATFLIVLLLDSSPATQRWVPVFAADAAVLLLPYWITGTRRGWRPVSLRQQVESLEAALQVIERFPTPPCQIQPMFEMAGSGEKRTPMAARVFVRFPEAPEDFLGLQFQVAVNDVQGTHYPYLYAVIIARPGFGLLASHFKAISRIGASLTVERSKDQEVEVIVIRQKTTKTSGYHTDPSAVRRIAGIAWTSVSRVLAGIATP
jgi:hypothetical protein